MNHPEGDMSKIDLNDILYENCKSDLSSKIKENDITDIMAFEDANESALLNSIVEAVMRGDMNQVVTLALSHRNTDSKDKSIIDDVLSSTLRNKLLCDQYKGVETNFDDETKIMVLGTDDVTLMEVSELCDSKKNSSVDLLASTSVYSTTMKSDDGSDIQCSYYIDSNSIIDSTNNITYCQPGFNNRNIELENQSDDHTSGNFTNYQSTSSIRNLENGNSPQQSVQVQLPGIGNFLLQIPSNLKPGEPITLPINLPLTPVSQTSGGNPISINMSTGQLISNQLLSLYNPSSCMNNITIGKKMRAIAPKPSKPAYRQPLIAPKTNSPSSSAFNQECLNTVNSTTLPAPSGPGRRKGTKGKKVGRKRGAQSKSRKNSSYASSTHSIDSQEGTQYSESSNTLKPNCNNYISGRNTYQCNYYVNSDSSDYINQSHVVPQSYDELHTNNLIDTSDSGEKDLLSLAWEISNADLGNNDDFSATYQLYDANNLSSEGFVSSEILDQFLQNIQKDEISELSRGSSNQLGLDQRVSYTSSFTTLPPCSTVLPSVTTSNYLNNSANNQGNLELSQCIEIAEVVNLNTEDMLSELEKEENALLDKFVAQYSSNISESLKCDTQMYATLNSSSAIEGVNYVDNDLDNNSKIQFIESKVDEAEKDLDQNLKESNELSEIAKQIEKDCNALNMSSSSKSTNFLSRCDYDYQDEVDNFNKSNENILIDSQCVYSLPNSVNVCRNVSTPIDLIFSTSTDSFNSTIVDGQNHYLMAVNMDNKRQGSSSFYLADGSLQSKTLDDFGLFDFCTSTEDIQNSDVLCIEDKKYLEPPILEDISDATPIPSDEESDDEDIDLSAFKLSALNRLPLLLSKVYHSSRRNIGDFCYTAIEKDLSTFLDVPELNQQNCISDKWYIYDTLIDSSDPFLCLKSRDTEDKREIDCVVKKMKNEDENVKVYQNKIEPIKHKRVKQTKNCYNSNVCDSSYSKERQSRLRKPPMKLAIYQSVKFVEKEISAENLDRNDIKTYSCVKSNQNLTAKHCTRSKGSISKSYDSFYETLEETNKHQHSKIRKVKNHLRHKKQFKSVLEGHDFKYDDLEVTSLLTDLNKVDNSMDTIGLDLTQSIPIEFEISSCSKDVKKVDIIITDDLILKNKSLALKDKKIKNMSKVSKKYYLRKNHLNVENNKKVIRSFFTKTSYAKIPGKGNFNNELINNKSKVCKSNIDSNKKNKIKVKAIAGIYKADILEIDDDGDILINSDLIIEQRMVPIEIRLHQLFKATVDIKYLTKSSVCKYVTTDNNVCSKLDKSFGKMTFPVRKINRKLRLLSGLENEKKASYGTIINCESFEDLIEYSLNTQVVEFSIFFHSLISYSECKYLTNMELEMKCELQNNETTDDDFDDGDSCDARLVIVENEDIFIETSVNNCQIVSTIDVQSEIGESKKSVESKIIDLPKRYSLRNKSKDIVPVIYDVLGNESSSPAPSTLRRLSLRRSCKKLETNHHDIIPDIFDEELAYNKLSLKTPVCSIEKLTDDDLIANLKRDRLPPDILNSSLYEFSNQNKTNDECDYCTKEVKSENNHDNTNLEDVESDAIRMNYEIRSKNRKRIKVNNSMLGIHQNNTKFAHRSKMNMKRKYSSGFKGKFQANIHKKKPIIEKDLPLVQKELVKSNDKGQFLAKNVEEIDDESITVDDVPEDRLCTYVDSNNIETFSRSYGSFSLKIKFQKEDPVPIQENKIQIKKRKRSSRRRKSLRHFLSRIIGSNANQLSNSISNSDNEADEKLEHNTRKRKHSNIDNGSIDSVSQENFDQNYDIPPNLTPESIVNDDVEHQKPIKIKLFKSTGDEFSKSEDMIFSLQKSNYDHNTDYDKSIIPKMLQVLKDPPSKPCRLAANLAKKKIFSTAKEDRRSQNATLTSIWNPRKLNSVSNKLPADLMNANNDRTKRPRGRPPKSTHASLLSDKQTSSTGTLKFKIKLSKDFKNCNDDNLSSNGEISGRTSTNDSSILNSAVAGINEPSDALSLESNHFINGITQHLDENIEYLEAKEAKVYFDPHQVDIEKIKNSYYSSKKNNSIHFDNESDRNLYDDSAPELCNKKKDDLCINQDFSQYIDNESSTSYNNNLSKEFSKNCYNSLSTNREPQDLSQSNQSYSFDNSVTSPRKNQPEHWQSTKQNSSELLSPCRNGNNSWFSDHRPFPNSNSILYDSYLASNKETKNCNSQSQNPPFIHCDNESSDSKPTQRIPSKRSSSKEGRKSSNNSFDSHSQLSPNYSRGGLGAPQLNIHPWSDESNHNVSINHTAAAWMTYAQQQAAAAYIDPQMKAYYNLALSQSMLNSPYCGSYGNPVGNPEHFYSSLHSQYLNNSKDLNEKNNNASSVIRNHNDPMGTFMEAAQMSSWEHFYSAAAMAGYHNSSQGTMDDYTGRAGSMLQAYHMLAGGYQNSVFARDHFPFDGNKPPLAHQNLPESASQLKTMSSPMSISSSRAYSHGQLPSNHFNGTPVGFF